MVRVSFLVVFAQLVSVLGKTVACLPTESPSFDTFTGSYDFFPEVDQTSSPSWSPTATPTDNGFSGRGLGLDDDVSNDVSSDVSNDLSGSGSLSPSSLACGLIMIPVLAMT